jgi:hypothetical protein
MASCGRILFRREVNDILTLQPTCSQFWPAERNAVATTLATVPNLKRQPFPIGVSKPFIMSVVRRRGLEPLCLAALAPQASASANFATSAGSLPANILAGATYNPKTSIAFLDESIEAAIDSAELN